MNERIKKLAEQAGFQYIKDEGIGWAGNYNDSLPKFAELIVRGCIKESMEEIVADEDIAKENDPLVREYLKGNNQGIVDAVVRFRNHFGVEE